MRNLSLCALFKIQLLTLVSITVSTALLANKNNLYSFQNAVNIAPTVNNGDCNINQFLDDFSCIDIDVIVSGVSGTSLQSDVYLREVRLIVQHEFPDDLDINLIAPSGQTVELTSDNGGAVQNYGTPYTAGCMEYMTFISNAVGGACNYEYIDEAMPPFTGTYLPEGMLTDFDTGSPNGTWVLQICDDQPADVGYFEFIELVFAPFSCTLPGPLTATTIDSTSVLLDWVAGGSCSNTIIEYGPAGFTPGIDGSAGMNGTIVNTGCPNPTYELMNLAPETSYDIYVRENCNMSMYSGNSCPLTITTLCSPSTPTIFEDFDNQLTCNTSCNDTCDLTGFWFNVNNDRLDWLINSGGTPTLSTGPIDDVTGGGNYIYMETSCLGATGGYAELYSHCVDVDANVGTCHLSFNYYMHGSTVNGIRLQATTNGINWVTVWQDFGAKGAEWLRAIVDLSNNLSGINYHGQTVQFRFSAQKLSGSSGDVALDNIAFHGSSSAGQANHQLFYDADGDDYGRDDEFYFSCFTNVPTTYATQGGDCDDNLSFINPGAPETPCDGFDINCNPNDEFLLAETPTGAGISVCSGTTDTLFAQAQNNGAIYWFEEEMGGTELHIGDFYVPNPVLNTTPNNIQDTFYIEEQRPDGCYSSRAAVVFTTQPQPETNQEYNIVSCIGDTVDLTIYPFIDEYNTNATISYHSSLPPNAGNELASPIFEVQGNEITFIVGTASGGCYDAIPIFVEANNSPQAQISGSPTMCTFTEQILEIQDVSMNSAPYQVAWSTGAGGTFTTTASTNIDAPLAAGDTDIITAILTNNSGCSDTTTFAVTATEGLLPISISTDPVSTCGGDDGEITLDPAGGAAPYTYTWDGPTNGTDTDGGGSFTIDNNVEQGAYQVTITDNSGCEATVPFIVVNGPAAIVEVESIQNCSCSEFDDGAIDLSIFGNNPSILWSNNATTEDLENLAPGTYSVTVTEGNCESIINNLVITEPDTLHIKPFSIVDASCHNANDGAINAIPTGGTMPYVVNWSNGAMDTYNISNLAGGTYFATVTDANDCEHLSIPFPVGGPEALNLVIETQQDISCFGANDGLISVSIIGGTSPYQVLWNNGSNNPVQNNLSAGNYTISVTDANGCTEVLSNLVVNEPEALTIQLSNQNNPDCVGSTDGFLSIQSSGGIAPYAFEWSDGSTNFAAFNLPAGEHSVTVTDINGCEETATYMLDAAIEIMATTSTTDAHCIGLPNGEANINILQGNAPFTYLWSNGDSTQMVDDLAVGIYDVTISDADNCQLIHQVEIGENMPIQANLNMDLPNCHGEATGLLQVMPSNGLPPFDITWDNTVEGEENPDLLAGYHGVIIEGADGCQLTMDSIYLPEPSPIVFEIIGVDSVICNGTNTGAIDLDVSGGDAPYMYTWVNIGANTEDLASIPAGTYQLNVTDQNNCTVQSNPIEVWEAPAFEVIVEDFDGEDDDCVVSTVDSLNITIFGGLPSYTVQWAHGPQTTNIQNVVPGDYEVTVTDALGCTQIINDIKVRDDYVPPTAFQLDTFNLQGECYTNNNLLCVVIEGGEAPFNYLWDDATVGTTSEAQICHTPNNTGNHSLVITDANNCSTEIDGLQISNIPPMNLFIAGAEHISCKDGMDGSIDIQINGGIAPYNYLWTNELGDTVGTTQNLIELPAGQYSVVVTDVNDCATTWDNFVLVEPESLLETTATILPVNCFDGDDGVIDLEVSGGDFPYTYMWSTGATTQDVDDLLPGTYSVTVTDANTCVRIVPLLEVEQPETPVQIASSEAMNATCYDANDGSINLEIIGGTPPYFYDWNFASPVEDPEDLAPGFYSCMITDSNNCMIETNIIEIEEPEELVVGVAVTDASMGMDNGSASVSPSGGTPNYEVLWNTGETTYGINNLAPGDYFATITDANNCILTIALEVEDIVSVIETDYFSSIALSPNPTMGQTTLSFQLLKSATIDIELVNLQGTSLWQNTCENCQSEDYLIDLQNMTSGAYFVLIRENGQIIGRRRVLKW